MRAVKISHYQSRLGYRENFPGYRMQHVGQPFREVQKRRTRRRKTQSSLCGGTGLPGASGKGKGDGNLLQTRALSLAKNKAAAAVLKKAGVNEVDLFFSAPPPPPVRCLERNAFQTPLTGGPACKSSPEERSRGLARGASLRLHASGFARSLPPPPPPSPLASSASRSAWSDAPGGFGWRSQNRGARARSLFSEAFRRVGLKKPRPATFPSRPPVPPLRSPVFHGHRYCTRKPEALRSPWDYNSDYIPVVVVEAVGWGGERQVAKQICGQGIVFSRSLFFLNPLC